MELRQLRYFAATVEESSLSRAARRLHISQPPLSTQIKALEHDLGVKLLERSNRGVKPTLAGAQFYQDIRTLLSRLDQACMRAQHAQRGQLGTLTIGFVSIADYSILPAALKQFRSDYPDADVQLQELTTDAQIRALRSSRLDLGIGLAPVDETDLEFLPLHQEPLLLAAPDDWQPSGPEGDGVDLTSLAHTEFIVPPRDIAPGLYDLTISRCHAAGFSPRITQSARQMQTVIGLVSSGMGVALVPASVQNLKRPGVQYRFLRGTPALIELGVVRPTQQRNPLADNFIQLLLASR